jgi:alkylation response protein AidB-like acyl-CoA dehydrogenase
MNLSWSEEQRLLIDSAQRFASRYYTSEVRSASRASPEGALGPVWRDLAEQGWLGVAVADSAGGFGGGALEIGILAEAAGRCLLLEPYLGSAVEAVRLLSAVAPSAGAASLLADIAAGKSRVAVAHREDAQPSGPSAVQATAEPNAAGWRLNGHKRFVMDAGAHLLLVSARDTRSGLLGLFRVEATRPGVERASFRTLDDRAAMHVALADVCVDRAARLDDGADVAAAADEARDAVRLALCSEAVGAMEVLLQKTLEYTQTRQQFGRPLAANQVLRHRMVGMSVALREARALALRAAIFEDQPDVTDTRREHARLGAMAKAAQAARQVGEEAIQMHGAMGVTEQLSVGLYVKRLMFCQMMWGSVVLLHETRGAMQAPPGMWAPAPAYATVAETA